MSDIDDARLMQTKAKQDLSALCGMMDKTIFAEEIFGFHAQQAVEKSLKAWLALIGVDFPLIHDLEELFALLKDQGQAVPDIFQSLVDLTDFSVQFRYDTYIDFEDELDRDEIIQKVQNFVDHVEQLLNNASTEASQSENDA